MRKRLIFLLFVILATIGFTGSYTGKAFAFGGDEVTVGLVKKLIADSATSGPGAGDVQAATVNQMWGDGTGPVVWTFSVTGTNPTITVDASLFTFSTSISLGANSFYLTGSIASSGSRVTKGWFTNIESTNMPTVGGVSLSSTFQPIFTSQTANYVYAAPNGSAGVPSFRALVAADIPSLVSIYQPLNSILTGISGLTPVANGIIGYNNTGTLSILTTHQHSDDAPQFSNASDATKQVKIDASNQTAGNTGSIRAPDGGTATLPAGTAAGLSVDQTFTGANQIGDSTTNKLQKIVLRKASSMSDHDWQGTAVLGTAGENLAQGDVVYKKYNSSAWKYYKYDANGTDKAIVPSGIAVAAITSGNDGIVLTQGVMRDDTWALSPSADSAVTIYASTTPGGVTLTAPSTSGDHVIIVGFLVGGNTIQTAFGYADVVK